MSERIQRLWNVYLADPEEKNFVPFYEGTHRFVYSLCFHLLRNEKDAVSLESLMIDANDIVFGRNKFHLGGSANKKLIF